MTKEQRLRALEQYTKNIMIIIGVILCFAWLVSVGASDGNEMIILIGTGSFLSLILGVFIDYFIAKIFYAIALDKGYVSYIYFWCCFILGPIGYLMVTAMPDRGSKEEAPVALNRPAFFENTTNESSSVNPNKTDDAPYISRSQNPIGVTEPVSDKMFDEDRQSVSVDTEYEESEESKEGENKTTAESPEGSDGNATNLIIGIIAAAVILWVILVIAS